MDPCDAVYKCRRANIKLRRGERRRRCQQKANSWYPSGGRIRPPRAAGGSEMWSVASSEHGGQELFRRGVGVVG